MRFESFEMLDAEKEPLGPLRIKRHASRFCALLAEM